MKRLIGGVVLAGALAFGQGSAPADPSGGLVKHAATIPYTGKPIMLMFDSSTCPYCKKIRKDLAENPTLHKEAVQFDLYNLPRDAPQPYTILGNKTTLQSLVMLYKVKATPNLVLMTAHGEKIWQLPGYVKPEVLSVIMAFVRGVDAGTYQKSEWKAYLRKHGII